jgi:two-component system, cell cycle response regulator DivK
VRVLIAEDNSENLDMLRRRLERRGMEVTGVSDGQAAVETARRIKPDLILMDVSMPILTGLEATRVIRSDPSIAQTPIIALTAHALEGDRARCIDAGCDAYATKPVDLPSLLAMMERFAQESVG